MYSNDINGKVCKEKEDDTLVDTIRYQRDLSRIQRTCAKYLGSLIQWTPFSTNKKEDKWNYYVDDEHKIGWCLNPKVLDLQFVSCIHRYSIKCTYFNINYIKQLF